MAEPGTSRHAAHKDWPICKKCLGSTELPAGSGRSRTCDPKIDGCTGTGREGPPANWIDPEYIDIPGVGGVLLHPGSDAELKALVAAGKIRMAADYLAELRSAVTHLEAKVAEGRGAASGEEPTASKPQAP